MFDKFLEMQAKRFISDSRDKFEEFLTSNDLDNNGEKDRQQLLDDFDQFAKGIHECVLSGSSIFNLVAAYYNKYGPQDESNIQKQIEAKLSAGKY
jgi:hypothetical protein